MRLFELTAQYRDLLALEDSDDIPPEVLRDTLDAISGEFEDKAVAVGKFILSLEASAESIDEAAKAMSARAARLKKRADNIRHYLLLQLQILDYRGKISTPELTISRRNNPVAVQVSDEVAIPLEYWRQPPPPPPQIDRKAIKTALQAGTEIPGVFLESGERVEIKI
jgi:hypothetical protein